MELQKVKTERKNYLPLLLLADDIAESYLHEGELFAIYMAQEVIGVMQCIAVTAEIIELKNFAIAEAQQNKGYGKMALQKLLQYYAQTAYKEMLVGTANSSIANLALYQKVGFDMVGLKRDFFLQYPQAIFENGIQAKHLVMLAYYFDETN